MAEKIILTEDTVCQKIQDLLLEIDADDLARLVGEIFGGDCYENDGEYSFYPNENYNNAFDMNTGV
jgi:hypothetical protein